MAKRDWKAITLSWLGLQGYDDVSECVVCLTQREIAILKALLTTAYWPTRWDNLGETESILEARIALLDGKLNYCSQVGGESVIIFTQVNVNCIAINVARYDGTTISININAPVTIWNEGGTADREEALCMACMSLVGTICAGELQALADRYAGSLLIFAALMILTGGLAAFGVLLVGTLIAGHTYNVAKAALEDRNAQLAVACCMYQDLRGKAVTAVVLAASLDNCGFTAGTNEAIARDYVHRSIQGQETYLAMLDAAGNAFAQVSVLGIHNCECGGWEHVFDFTTGQHGWTILNPLAGVYVAGTGFQATVYDGTNYGITLERLLVEREITKAEIFGVISGNQSYGNRFRLFTTSLTYQDISFFVPVPPGMDFELERVIANKLATKIHCEYPDSNAVYTISKIVLRGEGTNPF